MMNWLVRRWLRRHAAEILEGYARLSHSTWTGWMHHLFQHAWLLPGGDVRLPAALVSQALRQMKTGFAGLTDAEQSNDREEARKYLAMLYDLAR